MHEVISGWSFIRYLIHFVELTQTWKRAVDKEVKQTLVDESALCLRIRLVA